MSSILIDTLERRDYALRVIGKLPLDAPGWDLRIDRHVEHRSAKQNSRLWALHQKAGAHVGCSAAEMHEAMLCEHYGANEVQIPGGATLRVPVKRSSQRNVKEFAAYMEFCEEFYIKNLGVFLGDDDAFAS